MPDIQSVLLSLVPADGSTVGNGSLRGSLADKLGRSVDEAEYLAARDALVDAGSLIKGQGRGGSVRLTTPTAEGESVSEAETPAAKQGRKKKDATPAAVKGSSGMVALTRELWDAAVAMRGTIEPADYKRYVLPIIFLCSGPAQSRQTPSDRNAIARAEQSRLN